MNSGSSGNALTSGTTHSSEAPNTPHNSTKTDVSEVEFLQQQAQQAKDAISQTLSLIGSNLGHGADPRAWAKDHPWITVAGAAVGGFVAASLIIPTKEQQALKRLARIERAITPKRERATAGDSADSDKHPAKHGILYGIMNEALKAVKPALMSAIAAGVSAKAATSDKNDKQPPAGPADVEPVSAATVVTPDTPSEPAPTGL